MLTLYLSKMSDITDYECQNVSATHPTVQSGLMLGWSNVMRIKINAIPPD